MVGLVNSAHLNTWGSLRSCSPTQAKASKCSTKSENSATIPDFLEPTSSRVPVNLKSHLFAIDCILVILISTNSSYDQHDVTFTFGTVIVVAIDLHIFPKAPVASNKNVHNFWHHLLAEVFLALSLGVLRGLFQVLAPIHFQTGGNSSVANKKPLLMSFLRWLLA